MKLKTFREMAMQGVFFLTALASIASVAVICIFLFINGVPAIAEIGFFDFIFGQKWAPTNVPASYGIFDMTQKEETEAIEEAIDKLISIDPLDLYRKVIRMEKDIEPLENGIGEGS